MAQNHSALVGTKLRDTLAPHFGRFMTFNLVVAPVRDITFFFEAPSIHSAQLLESLYIRASRLQLFGELDEGPFIEGSFPFPPTPSLRTISISNAIPTRTFLPHIFRGLEDLSLDGQEMTSLEGQGVALDVIKALSACPDLRRLVLQGSLGLPPFFEENAVQPPILTFPKLTSIFIGPTCHNTGWLAVMTAPKLEVLTLAGEGTDNARYNRNWVLSWTPVYDFLVRSSPPLWKLGLFGVGGGDAGRAKLLGCLEVLKDLRELWVRCTNLNPAAFFCSLGKMTPEGSGQYICPKLEEVVLTSNKEEDITSLNELCVVRPGITATVRM
jgi:hypothetical protein